MSIDSTAIIESEVELAEDVEVGAYSVLRGKIKIGKGTVIKDHVTIYGPITFGENNTIHPGAVLGNVSQDLKYKGEAAEVVIGDNNSIREYVTIQKGTADGGAQTIIGNNNLLMGYVHIAHDCRIGNNVIIANTTSLAGHVIIDNYAYIGGLSGIHQFVTIGESCFVGFMSRINKDVPPYSIVEGNPARPRTINSVGLTRRNFHPDDIALIKKAFVTLYVSKVTRAEKLQTLQADEFKNNEFVQNLLAFDLASAKAKSGRALEELRDKG
ncbi:MAG: acyl-ACP--UDP-N-acetylglucosamine O-acyltransferase [Bacteroidetes bacterium]|nr:acyl-ACP--UDP-N-acetylglucosamine O-acyltransferase [Bacteroidota bacterium]